jgi:colanic acid/amylovoran biosynthesis glycosyltransferase
MNTPLNLRNSKDIYVHDEKRQAAGRIAYILDSFPNISETFISNEINELIALGYEVEIFSCHRPKSSMLHDSAKFLLTKTLYLPKPISKFDLAHASLSLMLRSPIRFMKTIYNAKFLPGKHFAWTARQSTYLAEQIAKRNFDRIHVHFASDAACYGMFASKFLNLPLTLTVHSPLSENESQGNKLNVVGQHAKAVVTISAFNKKYIIENFGIPARKIHINPNGIQNNVFLVDPTSQRVPGRILTVARLHPDKGVKYAIEAASILHKKGVHFEWIIIGDGPERNRLEEQIGKSGLNEKIKLLGFQLTSEVIEQLKIASIFALSSISESQGVVYLEAMAMGTPIVGTDIYGVCETVIDGKTGFLVPTENPEALAEKILQLLNDEVLRKNFSDASLVHVKKQFLLLDRVKQLTEIWVSSQDESRH